MDLDLSFSFLKSRMGKIKHDSTVQNATDLKGTKNSRKNTHGKSNAQESIAISPTDALRITLEKKRRKSVTADIVDIGNGFS